MSQADAQQRRTRPAEAELQPPPEQPDAIGVHQHLDMLRKSLAQPTLEQEKTKARTWIVSSAIVRRCIKAVVSLVLVAVLGWVPLQRLLLTTSAEATVN